MAGLTRDAPDPPDGRIERETPFGILHEGAMQLVAGLVPVLRRTNSNPPF